ncbi:MAG: PorT family protein [Bacteroidales bacterium]|nr:PorT family protein [Bacteroidales bacterium]
MKKIFTAVLAAVLLLAGTNAFAQLSVGAGWLNSTLTGTYSGSKQDNETSNGLYVGASYNIHLVAGLNVAPGLYYSMITSKTGADYGKVGTVTGKFMEHAINIPVNLNYMFDLRGVQLFVFAGPTFQFGLSSKYTWDTTGPAAITLSAVGLKDGVVNAYKDENAILDISHYKPFNIYMGGGVGANISEAFQVTVGFDYGLMNLYRGDTKDTKYNRYNIKIGLAYLF